MLFLDLTHIHALSILPNTHQALIVENAHEAAVDRENARADAHVELAGALRLYPNVLALQSNAMQYKSGLFTRASELN